MNASEHACAHLRVVTSPEASAGSQHDFTTELVVSVDPPPAATHASEDKSKTRKRAGEKDVAGKTEAAMEASSSLLLPRAAEGMKEHLLKSTFLGGVAGATMGALLEAGQSVPIFGEVP